MVGVDPYNAESQYEYHRRQELDTYTPPMSINKRTRASQRHFYTECPNIPDDGDFNATWGS